MNPIYPAESLPFPGDLLLSFTTLGLFFIFLLSYRQFHLLRNTVPSGQWGTGDRLTLVGLFVTVLGTLIYPFIQNPMIDYDVTIGSKDKNNLTSFQTNIRNWGLSSAKNIIISYNMPHTDFIGINSTPYLSNYMNMSSDKNGDEFIKIEVIPPRTETKINGRLNFSERTAEELITYVRSDERVGHHDALIKLIFYLLIILSYSLISVYLLFWNKVRGYEVTRVGQPMQQVGAQNQANTFNIQKDNVTKRLEWIPLRTRSIKSILKYVALLGNYIFIFWWIYLSNKNLLPKEISGYAILISGLALITFAVLLYISFFKRRGEQFNL